jgi:serine/threonine protein kinase
MAPNLCPYCGKPSHGSDGNFDCPGRSDQKTVATGAPAFPPAVDHHKSVPSQPLGGFAALDAALGTKLGAGTKVGEYQIQSRVGEGGMGTVYSAVHPIIGKKVAIKVLAGRLAKNKNAISRFVLEARAVNDIQHPGLVDIFSFGQLTDGRHYYVMEFLEGRNLGDVLRERVRLPAAEIIPIFREVSQALVAVHAKGIVHRDLKPENILLLSQAQPGGHRVKLVDFGLAKLIEGVPAHLSEGGPRTAAGVNVGTPHYMSPEQCRGMKVDARSDLYSLGILLYETLTGRLPFDGPTPLDIWQAHSEKAPQPPIELAPGNVSPAMNAITLRLLAKSADNRYQTAADFCAALDNLNEAGQPRRGSIPVPVVDTPSGLLRPIERTITNVRARPEGLSREVATRGRPVLPSGPTLPKPAVYDELATTAEDLHPVQLPEVAFSEEDRRKEIENLRASLGLHIEEPATDSQEEEQMSALVINLGPSTSARPDAKSAPRAEQRPIALPPAGSKIRPSTRPIEERSHVPPLAAPTTRGTGQARTTGDRAALARRNRTLGIVVAAVVFVVAAALAWRLIK